MNSFELNKIIGAVLGTLLFVMGVGFLAEAIYHPIEDRGPGYPLPEPEGTEVAAAEAAPEVDLGTLLASASAEAGASSARKCQSCHTFEAGGANKTGPNLYGVVGRPIASHEGYSYSAALQEHAGENWTYEHLDAFLHNPQEFAPGSKMPLAVSDPEERADIMAYLQTLSDSPVPFPEPAAAPAEGGEEVPEGEAVEEPADAGAPEAVSETPTETQSESPVEGTPTTSGEDPETLDEAEPAPAAPGEAESPAQGAAPAEEAAPAEQAEPAAGSVPATQAPATVAPEEEAPAEEPAATETEEAPAQ